MVGRDSGYRLLVGALVLVIVGMVIGWGVRGEDATAQDTDAERFAALETQVAALANTVSSMYPRLLPESDPEGKWLGANYVYDWTLYSVDLLCSIGQLGTDYALRCTRPQPMVP